MRNKGIVILIIVILLTIGISLSFFMVNLIKGNISLFKINKISNELVIDETYETNFEKVSVTTDMGDTYIKTSNDNTFKVVIYGDKENTEVTTTNQELNIETKSKKCFGICFNQKASKVEIYIPNNFDKEIHVLNKFGDIEVDRLTTANMQIEAKAGDIKIDEAYDIDVKNDYGNIEINKARTAKIKESCGDVKIKEVEYLTVKNDYGDIKIDKVTNYLDIEESCGDVKIQEIDLKNNSKIKNNLGNIEIGSTNQIYINASVDLGDIKISNNYRESAIELTLENNCGDIKVQN